MIRFDRRTFLATGAATAAFAAGTVPAFAQSERGPTALRALLDTIFADDLLASPQDATGYGLDKGRYAPFLRGVPTYLITAADMTLLGASAMLDEAAGG